MPIGRPCTAIGSYRQKPWSTPSAFAGPATASPTGSCSAATPSIRCPIRPTTQVGAHLSASKELLCDPQLKDGRTPKMNSKALSTKRSAPGADRPTARLPKGASAMRIARCSRSRWPLCGAKSFTAVREFAASLTQAQLKRLYARFNRKAARPRGPLGAHPQAGAAELRRRGPRPAPLLSPTPTTLSPGAKMAPPSALRLPAPASVAQIEVGRENQRNPRAQAPAGAPGYPGVLTADAMHSQRETARFRVEADSLFIAKNQKSIREDIAALGHDDFSPCRHPVR